MILTVKQAVGNFISFKSVLNDYAETSSNTLLTSSFRTVSEIAIGTILYVKTRGTILYVKTRVLPFPPTKKILFYFNHF